MQQQEQSATSDAKQQASNHFRNRMRMNDQPRITHHSGQNIAGNNGRFTKTGGETGAEQPQEDRPEGRRERGMAAKAGVVQLANPQAQPIKASLEAQTMAPVIPNSKLHCHASNRDVLRSIKTIKNAAALSSKTVLSPKNEMSCQFIYL